MKGKLWSIGLILCLAVLVGSLALVYYIAAKPWSDDSPPPFDELKVVSGQVEYVKWNEGGEYEHSSIEIKLRELPNGFLYWTPHIREVDLALRKALKEHSSAKLWVALRYYNYPAWSVVEVWQVAVDGIIISPYQSRVAWGKSNARLGKIIVSFFLVFFLTLIPGIYLYGKMRGR